MNAAQLAGARGSRVDGYRRKEVWQFSLGAADSLSNVLGAQRLAWAVEAGANWIGGLDPQDERFGRSGAFGRTPTSDGTPCFTPRHRTRRASPPRSWPRPTTATPTG